MCMAAVRDMSFSTSDKSIIPRIKYRACRCLFYSCSVFWPVCFQLHCGSEAEVLKTPLNVNDEKMAVESSAEEVFLAERIVDSGFGQVRC